MARQEQLTAFPEPDTGRVKVGRTERAVGRDLTAARKAGTLTDTDNGLSAAARQAARSVDQAVELGKFYAVPQLLRELRETMIALGLVQQRTTGGDDGGWVASIGAATVPHSA